jgi:hypothetical protein
MNKGAAIRALFLLALLPALAWAGGDRWLHVRVQEGGEHGEKVSVNLPLQLVEAVLPLIEEEELCGGKVKIDNEELSGAQIREILKALRDAEEGEYIRVEDVDEDVRVAKEGDFMIIRVFEERGKDEDPNMVRVRIHLSVIEALLSGEDEDELDVLAAVHALGEQEEGELVVVNDEESTVEIWVDGKSHGK